MTSRRSGMRNFWLDLTSRHVDQNEINIDQTSKLSAYLGGPQKPYAPTGQPASKVYERKNRIPRAFTPPRGPFPRTSRPNVRPNEVSQLTTNPQISSLAPNPSRPGNRAGNPRFGFETMHMRHVIACLISFSSGGSFGSFGWPTFWG